MGLRFHPRLVTWFETGLAAAKFEVPNGRHIVLNEFPRLMKEARLRASAGVDPENLHEFLLALNPNVMIVADGSPSGLRQHLALECDQLPGLRKVTVPVFPTLLQESWFVYTPPLHIMRQSWRDVSSRLALAAA